MDIVLAKRALDKLVVIIAVQLQANVTPGLHFVAKVLDLLVIQLLVGVFQFGNSHLLL
jgi:hypothetical protein